MAGANGERVAIESTLDGARIQLARPGATFSLVGRALLYGVCVVFAICALVGSDFSLIAWIATLPFMLVGGRLFYLMVLYSRMQTEIAIDRVRFQVHTRGLRADELLEGSSAHLKVVGPVWDQPRSFLLALAAVRFTCSDQELELGHGLSEQELRAVLRELKPYAGSVEELR